MQVEEISGFYVPPVSPDRCIDQLNPLPQGGHLKVELSLTSAGEASAQRLSRIRCRALQLQGDAAFARELATGS